MIRKTHSFISALARSVDRALFPPKCHVCGVFIKNDRQRSGRDDIFAQVFAPYLCADCMLGFSAIESPLCPLCGVMFAGRSGEDHLCGDCIQGSNKFTRVRSTGVYNGTLLTLVHRLKYHGRTELARPLGALLFKTYMRNWAPGEIDLILPVPLHPRKLRRRGFNQAHLLMLDWPPDRSGSDAGRQAEIRADILHRIRWTASQTGLGRAARRRNIKGAFALKNAGRFRNRSVLLVDDVYTTGATVMECARVLKAAGAGRMDVLTLARTI